MTDSDVDVEVEVEIEIDEDELEIAVGETEEAEAELQKAGVEIELEVEIERTGGDGDTPERRDDASVGTENAAERDPDRDVSGGSADDDGSDELPAEEPDAVDDETDLPG